MAVLAEVGTLPARAVDLDQVYRAHASLVLRVAYRMTGRMADAEDVLQTVFLRMATRPPQHLDRVEAYLRRAAVNAALDLLRSRQQLKRVALDGEGNDAAAAEIARAAATPSSEEAEGLRQALRLALGRIRPRSAEMFVLRYVEGLDNREIARLLNTSAMVVAVMLHRVRGQLQRELRAVMRGVR